jgi:hypothetical protein
MLFLILFLGLFFILFAVSLRRSEGRTTLGGTVWAASLSFATIGLVWVELLLLNSRVIYYPWIAILLIALVGYAIFYITRLYLRLSKKGVPVTRFNPAQKP